MMSLVTGKQVRGDLVKMAMRGDFDVLVHGCNCFNTMGAGIAKQIRKAIPQAYEADLEQTRGDRSKLGKFTYADVFFGDHKLTVVNAYTQFQYGKIGVFVELDAVRTVMRRIKKSFTGLRIAYPMIGAGKAHGDWDQIEAIIQEELAGEDHTLVIFER